MHGNLGILAVVFSAKIAGFVSNINKAQKVTSGMMKHSLFLAGTVATGMAIAVHSIMQSVQKSIRAFAEFEDKLTFSTTVFKDFARGSREEMRNMALEMSTKTRFSANQLAESLFHLGSAGLNAEQSLKSMKAVSDFAAAGMFSLTEATDRLELAQSALGLKSENANEHLRNTVRISDALVTANMTAQASVKQFSEALTNNAASAMKAVNMDM